MTRRNFIASLLTTLPLVSMANDFSSYSATIEISGDLDDDLFIIKTSPRASKMIVCKQMHNPREFFDYRGTTVASEPIYGLIDYKETHKIKKDEILTVMLANEREEINDLPTLRKRTHFKAVNLYCNDKVGIPSLMPEWNDVPDYPVWFGKNDFYCSSDFEKTKSKNYNYYKMWENAICGTVIITPFSGLVEVVLFNKDNDITFKYNINISNKPKQLVSDAVKNGNFPHDLLVESNGKVYNNVDDLKSDDEIRQKAAQKMIIKQNSQIYVVDFPYPMPYPNRIYIQSIY